MGKELIHNFVIKVVSTTKVRKEPKTFTKISKKCQAIVVKDGDELKASIPISPSEYISDCCVLPFTPDSLSLKGKTHVFSKEKDEKGHYITYIRDKLKCRLNPGSLNKLDVLKEGLLIEGHIVKKDGKHYFNYEELIAYSQNGPFIKKQTVITDNE